ncbi:hypothetical protein GJAV_G00071360 [Gymnothorax javanicus]|nr:hypothetical protein GJAV_G00071360 [Gymnothorax javanicus]
MFLSVLYLLVYSSFSTAKLTPALVTQVDKAVDTSVKLAKCMDEIGKWALKAEETAKTIEKVLKVFDALAKLASGLSFVGALVGFIFAFIPKQDPVLEFMKVQFSEVNRKLDSIALQISSLAKEMEWAAYASVYSNDENNIKTSWIKLREFIDSAAEVETQQEKTRLAERFTTFYENAGTEKSVYNFYSYLTENNPASLNKNLLVLVTEKSKGNFKTLVQFTSYFTSLMVTGLQLNLYYYMLKGYDRKPKTEEAVSQLTDVRTKIQDILIECADNFEVWAEKDVQEIGTQPLPDKMHLAYRIKEHLEKKFSWYEWTVIVHDKKDAEETTYGNSFKVVAQDKVVIHVLHREKGFTVNEAPLDKDGQTISHSVEACSESYGKKVDYFVRMMFSFEKEAFLGWQRYQLDQKNMVTSKDTGLHLTPLSSVSGTQEYQSNKDGDSMAIFKQYVSQQWSLFNKNGCGPLKAEHLSNMYCEKPYHSTDQQEVPLTCESIGHFRPLGGPSRRFPPGQHEPRQPFPVTVKCSKGRWSALPVCYTDPAGGSTTCATESGATVCTASCLSGWSFADGQTTDTYRCTTQPCPSFNPRACDRCATNSPCGNSEVCSNGKCVDGCSVYSCGVNAQCTTSGHVQSCSCVHPWVVWKNEHPHTEGCRYKDLQWMDRSMYDSIPGNAVKSQAGHHVCRATGPDGGWHGGWIWIHDVNTCNYDYDWSEKRADKYQVLVDPCGGSGVTWISGGIFVDTVEIGQAILWPWITYLVCSVDSNGVPGKLFNTRSGLKCHYGYNGKGDRADSFKSLVKKPCV